MSIRKSNILNQIRELAAKILPANSRLLLYGSRARGDFNESSDWDMLIILDKQHATHEDFDKYAFPFCMLGAELQEIFSPIVYGKGQWEEMSISPFHQNVSTDQIILH